MFSFCVIILIALIVFLFDFFFIPQIYDTHIKKKVLNWDKSL